MPSGPLTGLAKRLSDRLYELRAGGEGVKQREIAERLGISESAVSYWASGVNQPECERIPEIAYAIGVYPAWLAWGHEPKELGESLRAERGPGPRVTGPQRTRDAG